MRFDCRKRIKMRFKARWSAYSAPLDLLARFRKGKEVKNCMGKGDEEKG